MAHDKKVLGIVVKGLDSPFFERFNLGCRKWIADNPDSEYKRLYAGPASSAEEAGEMQIVADLLTRGVAAVAILPSNAPAMAKRIREMAPFVPVMTIDADFLPANPDLGAFILIGGWAQFAPQADAQVTDQVMDKLTSNALIIIAGDTLPPQTQSFREGPSHVASASGRSRWACVRRT